MQHRSFHRMITLLVFAVLVLSAFSSPRPASAALAAEYYATPLLVIGADCSMDHPCSLQSAINAAADGSTVYLRYGSYNRAVDPVVHIDKGITLQGGWNGLNGRGRVIDPNNYATILSGEKARRVVLIDGGSSPTLRGLIIQDGYASQAYGGGIVISNPTGGSVTIEDCRIQGNTSGWSGGAIWLSKGTLTIQDSMIGANVATNGGAAIYAAIGTTVFLTGNEFSYNTAEYGSVGHFDRASITAQSNWVYANKGDPFSINGQTGQTIQLENNVISDNAGTAVSINTLSPSTVSFLHNTLSHNTSGLSGGANMTGMIANNIFDGQNQNSIFLGTGYTVTISHNLFWSNGSDPNPGSQAITADPIIDFFYHLRPGSPAINAGTTVGVTIDQDGNRRPVGLPDIGADEYMLPMFVPLVTR